LGDDDFRLGGDFFGDRSGDFLGDRLGDFLGDDDFRLGGDFLGDRLGDFLGDRLGGDFLGDRLGDFLGDDDFRLGDFLGEDFRLGGSSTTSTSRAFFKHRPVFGLRSQSFRHLFVSGFRT
jgi:hypothetical protein